VDPAAAAPPGGALGFDPDEAGSLDEG